MRIILRVTSDSMGDGTGSPSIVSDNCKDMRNRSSTPSPDSSASPIENETSSSLASKSTSSKASNDVSDDISPEPSVEIILLQGQPKTSTTSLYMMTDGTGSIASLIHLKPFKSKQVVYGIGSPYHRCVSHIRTESCIDDFAERVVSALTKANASDSFVLGG